MNRSERNFGQTTLGFTAFCLSWVLLALPAAAADNIPYGFDSGGEKIFTRYNETPLAAISGTDGRRNLNSFYELRQYPGSPPRIPHKVSPSFSGDTENCIACHGRGGYDVEQDAYAPVTPHPEKELCYQCHVPKLTDELFVGTNCCLYHRRNLATPSSAVLQHQSLTVSSCVMIVSPVIPVRAP